MVTRLDRLRLARYGALRMRRCFDPAFIDALRREAQRICDERTANWAETDALPAAERRAHVRRMSTIRLDDLLMDGSPAAPRLASPRILALARAHLGREPEREPNSYVRRLVPSPTSRPCRSTRTRRS